LTALDLSLDRSVERQYELGKAAARSFSRPEFFADQEPRFTGDLGMGSGSSAFRQGVLAGELQIAVDAVLDRTATALNIKSFAQFHKDLSNGEADVADMVEPFARSWRKFDPEGRPVFWRIIMAQLFIYRAIRLHRDRDLTDKDILARVKLSPSEHDEFAFSSLPEHRSEVDAAYRTGLLFLEATLEYRNPFL
jgi:hypothetical protein